MPRDARPPLRWLRAGDAPADRRRSPSLIPTAHGRCVPAARRRRCAGDAARSGAGVRCLPRKPPDPASGGDDPRADAPPRAAVPGTTEPVRRDPQVSGRSWVSPIRGEVRMGFIRAPCASAESDPWNRAASAAGPAEPRTAPPRGGRPACRPLPPEPSWLPTPPPAEHRPIGPHPRGGRRPRSSSGPASGAPRAAPGRAPPDQPRSPGSAERSSAFRASQSASISASVAS